MNSLIEVKEFDKLKVVKNTYKDHPRRPMLMKMPTKRCADTLVAVIPYKVDTCSNGNIMPLHIYKKMFPKITNEQLVGTKKH